MEKLFGFSVKTHISLARLAQGSKEFNGASDEEIAGVLKAWKKNRLGADTEKKKSVSR